MTRDLGLFVSGMLAAMLLIILLVRPRRFVQGVVNFTRIKEDNMPLVVQTISLIAGVTYLAEEFLSNDEGQPTGEAVQKLKVTVLQNPENIEVIDNDVEDTQVKVTPINFQEDLLSPLVGSDTQWDGEDSEGRAVRALVHINNVPPGAPAPLNGTIVFTPVTE